MMLWTQTTWAQTAMAHQAVRRRSPESDWFIPEEGRESTWVKETNIRVGRVIIGILFYCLRVSLASPKVRVKLYRALKLWVYISIEYNLHFFPITFLWIFLVLLLFVWVITHELTKLCSLSFPVIATKDSTMYYIGIKFNEACSVIVFQHLRGQSSVSPTLWAERN